MASPPERYLAGGAGAHGLSFSDALQRLLVAFLRRAPSFDHDLFDPELFGFISFLCVRPCIFGRASWMDVGSRSNDHCWCRVGFGTPEINASAYFDHSANIRK